MAYLPYHTLYFWQCWLEIVYLFFQEAGYITKGSVKLQVNAILGDLTGIPAVKQFSNMILPLTWADFVSIRILVHAEKNSHIKFWYAARPEDNWVQSTSNKKNKIQGYVVSVKPKEKTEPSFICIKIGPLLSHIVTIIILAEFQGSF